MIQSTVGLQPLRGVLPARLSAGPSKDRQGDVASPTHYRCMVELVYTAVLDTAAERIESSSLSTPTKQSRISLMAKYSVWN